MFYSCDRRLIQDFLQKRSIDFKIFYLVCIFSLKFLPFSLPATIQVVWRDRVYAFTFDRVVKRKLPMVRLFKAIRRVIPQAMMLYQLRTVRKDGKVAVHVVYANADYFAVLDDVANLVKEDAYYYYHLVTERDPLIIPPMGIMLRFVVEDHQKERSNSDIQ